MSDKENTLMNVMIEVVERHFETTLESFELCGVGNYADTDQKYLKEFMDQVCRQITRDGSIKFKAGTLRAQPRRGYSGFTR
eukprot:SAG22_NODE_521_length_9507_cov_62.835991_5_plen_81_part_00